MKKLAIVGTGPETRSLAPFNDASFDIWVFNEAPMDEWCKRYDAVFQLHSPEIYTGHNVKHPTYWTWLQAKHNKPVYMQCMDERVPDSETLPLGNILDLGGYRYAGMSMCYAVGLGLLRGYEHIEVWGVELSFTEYQYGADSWRYWIGLATGRLGTEHVILHCGLHLFENPLYGYEGSFTFDDGYFNSRVHFLDAQWTAADKNLHGTKDKIIRLIGNRKFQQVMDMVTDVQNVAMTCGEYAGALAEAERYAGFADRAVDRGGFEYAAAVAAKDGEEKRSLMFRSLGKVEYVWNVWKQHSNNPAAEQQLVSLIGALIKDAYDTGAYHGVYAENIGYIVKYDSMVQANGGKISQAPILVPEMAAL